jgi:hypothetical protein
MRWSLAIEVILFTEFFSFGYVLPLQIQYFIIHGDLTLCNISYFRVEVC